MGQSRIDHRTNLTIYCFDHYFLTITHDHRYLTITVRPSTSDLYDRPGAARPAGGDLHDADRGAEPLRGRQPHAALSLWRREPRRARRAPPRRAAARRRGARRPRDRRRARAAVGARGGGRARGARGALRRALAEGDRLWRGPGMPNKNRSVWSHFPARLRARAAHWLALARLLVTARPRRALASPRAPSRALAARPRAPMARPGRALAGPRVPSWCTD